MQNSGTKSLETNMESSDVMIILNLHNKLGKVTTVYKVDGTLRIGSITSIKDWDIRHDNGVNYFSENYLQKTDYYFIDNFLLKPTKLEVNIGAANELLQLYWSPPKKLRSSNIFSAATIFQLRKKDLFDTADDDYHYYLAKIYESFIQEKFSIPKHRQYSFENFSMVGVELSLRIYHTFGITEYKENKTFGVLPGYEVEDVFFSWE